MQSSTPGGHAGPHCFSSRDCPKFAKREKISALIAMSTIKIIGFSILALLWFWLSRAIVVQGGGFTLKNIFLIVASAIIIFVPLWKKYVRQDNNQKKR